MSRNREHIREAREALLADIGVPKQQTFKPDPFQLRAIESLARGEDTLVIAPTGTGKTYIAVEGIKQAVSQKMRAIYTAPLKALSNTKYADFKVLFEPGNSVGILTGDRKIETDADVVVATTEIYRNDLYSYGEHYSLVVLDELHYLADPQRGPVWEESIILSPKSSTLLMLSASISNAEEIASWIQEVRGKPVSVIREERRPVQLRLGFLHPELGVIPLADDEGKPHYEVQSYYDGAGGGGGRPDRRFQRQGGKSRRGNSRRRS